MKCIKSDNNNEEDSNIPSNLQIPLKTKKKYKKSDFEFISLIGQGAYAKVYKVKDKTENNESIKAIKVMEISEMKRLNKLYQIYLENNILLLLSHPNIVSIQGIFEEKIEKKIYIVLEYLNKGDLSDLLSINYPLHEETIIFYSAEIVNMLEYLMNKKIVHRDLKPENIMITNNFHLKVIDFATSKILGKYFNPEIMDFEDENEETDKKHNNNDNTKDKNKETNKDTNRIQSNKKENNINSNKNIEDIFSDDDDYDDNVKMDELNDYDYEKQFRDNVDDDENIIVNRQKRGNTFVGTAEYVSPEVLNDIPPDYGADLWALGCIIYLMHFGITPFKGKTEYLIFKNIKELKIEFPSDKNISEDAKDIIIKLLEKDPKKRLGNGEKGTENDFEHLKSHNYFKGINFSNLYKETVPFTESFKLKEELIQKKILEKQMKQNTNENQKRKIEVVKQGILYKKSPFLHYNRRLIVIDNTPKLDYIEPGTNQIKGTVFFTKDCSAVLDDDKVFFLITPARKFKFKCEEKEASNWVNVINDLIKKYS